MFLSIDDLYRNLGKLSVKRSMILIRKFWCFLEQMGSSDRGVRKIEEGMSETVRTSLRRFDGRRRSQDHQGLNFTIILRASFLLVDPKSIKNTVKSSVSFYAFMICKRKSCTYNIGEIDKRSQFHQHFTSTFFRTNMFWKL